MMYKLFREPEGGEATVIGADPSEGKDYCAAVAKSKKIGDTFMVFHARIDSAQFGYELHKMAKFIQKRTGDWPLIGVERNVGAATIHVLQTQNYPHLYRMYDFGVRDPDPDTNKIGWVTNTFTRQKLLDELAMSMRQHSNIIPDEEIIDEFHQFVINSRTGKAEAAPEKNDDFVFAEGIAWQLMTTGPDRSKEGMQQFIYQFPKQELFDRFGVPNV